MATTGAPGKAIAKRPTRRSRAGAHARNGAGHAHRAVVRFWRKAYRDGITGLAGMVAYNLLLSLLPLTLLTLFILGHVLRGEDVAASVIDDLHRILPSTQDSNLTGLIDGIERNATSIGIAAVLSSVWVGASFWGALDTAFARIYRSDPARTWLQQKRFALTMLVVTLLLIALTVAMPALQSAIARGSDDLPFGLSANRAFYVLTLALGLIGLFCVLCLVYRAVPNERVPWRGVWPGALGATIAIALVDWGFPVYLAHGSTFTSLGGTFVFITIVLVWFYVIALVILGAGVLNAILLGRDRPARR